MNRYTASAINEFCDLTNVTRRGNENIIAYTLLEHCLRKELDKTAERTMAVLDPVKLVLVNVEDDFKLECKGHYFPREPEKGAYSINLLKENYIDRSDVKLQDSKEFYGFAPNKIVGLKYAHPVKVVGIETDANNEITVVKAELLKDSAEKPKSYVSWVPCKESIECETRLYDILLNAYNPNQEEDFLTTVNKNSLIVHKHSRVHNHVKGNLLTNLPPIADSLSFLIDFKVGKHYQFERFGFFAVDQDTNAGQNRFVFNRAVTLAEKDKQKALKA